MFDPAEFDLTAANRELQTSQEAVRQSEEALRAAKEKELQAQRKLAKATAFDAILREIRKKIGSLQAKHRESELARFTSVLGADSRLWASTDNRDFIPQEFGRWLEGRRLLDTQFLADNLKALQGVGGDPFAIPSKASGRRNVLTDFANLLLRYVEIDRDWPALEVVGSNSTLLAEVEIRFMKRDLR